MEIADVLAAHQSEDHPEQSFVRSALFPVAPRSDGHEYAAQNNHHSDHLQGAEDDAD